MESGYPERLISKISTPKSPVPSNGDPMSLGQCQPSSMSPCALGCPAKTLTRVPSSNGPRKEPGSPDTVCVVVTLQKGSHIHSVIAWPSMREGVKTSSVSLQIPSSACPGNRTDLPQAFVRLGGAG